MVPWVDTLLSEVETHGWPVCLSASPLPHITWQCLYDRQVQQLQEQAQICMRGVSARSTPWSLI